MAQKHKIIFVVILGCLIVAMVDASAMDYVLKALLKILVFLSLPLGYARWIGSFPLKPLFGIRKKPLLVALGLGSLLIFMTLTLFLILRPFLDLRALTTILEDNFTSGTLNFLPIAFYIAVINAFLEEFFFRGFAYLTLQKAATEKFATMFSAVAFALYHVFLMAGLFPLWLYLSAIAVLVLAGWILNALDKAGESILPSWLLHGLANTGLNLIALILLKVI